jgi:hypothetical protein
LTDGVSSDRAADVLKTVLAEVGEIDADLALNLLISGRRDAAGFRAMPSSRAATLTPSPKMSSPSIMISPILIPIRYWICGPIALAACSAILR